MSTESLGDAWKYDPEYNQVAKLLGLDVYEREDFEVAKKISLLRDYIDLLDGKVESTTEALDKIVELKKNLGTNNQGTTLLGELYEHARLGMDKRREEAVTPKPKVEKVEVKEPPKEESIKEAVKQTIEGLLQVEEKS